jgi:hypothetical protein
MPAKKKGPSMRENQKRKATMQKIAKGGPQKSGVKKPAAAKPAAPARASIGNVRGPGGRGRPASAQAKDAKSWQKMNQLGSAKSAKAAEPKPRTPAPGTGNVLQSAIDRSKALKDAARQANRSRVATRDAARASGAKGAVAALAGAAAEKVLGPVARKAGGALAERVLKPAARKLDDAMPGVNSKDEAKRRNAQAASKGSTSKFKGARDAAVKKASAIKGSPVVGPRKSSSGSASAAKQFDSAFAAARKAGKSTFTWKGKKYTTKVK